jgi:serine/threonine-protein kinase
LRLHPANHIFDGTGDFLVGRSGALGVADNPGTDRWSEIDRLLDQALDVAPGDRAGWLDQVCAGDAALRDRLEALLRADAAAQRFLELDAPRYAAPLLADVDAESPGESLVGSYRLVRELARGGMGVVYLAERADGLFEQRVALKLIKRGMDSDEIHRRFLAERQILARLTHPHIARLLDGGISAQGQPYFALEYVDGETITAHAQERSLGIDERLRLFLDACDAVRYAHQNLVVHRDLKPSNILVTADGEVKLLDFGIAKLLDPGVAGDTGLTETGVRVMTPDYGAPEQLMGRPVTTATDVYALGAVLYELLSGRRAHRFEHRTPVDIERVVCQIEPDPPSQVAPEARRRRLRGDLDVIVLTAMRKEPERRYQTVEQLAGDIRRHLDGLPVAARRDTRRYRAAKFVGRHRLGFAASAAVVLALVAGLAGTVWQGLRAAERARIATAEAAKHQAVRDFLVDLFQASDPEHSQGRDVTARELLDQSRHGMDSTLAGQPAIRAELLTVLGTVHRSLGLYAPADTLLGQAVALTGSLPGDVDAELATRLTEWATILLERDEHERADSLLREALARLRRSHPDDPRASGPLRMLGLVEVSKGNHKRGVTFIREALTLDLRHHGERSREVGRDLTLLGQAWLDALDLPGADSAFRAALAVHRELLPADHPAVLSSLGYLAEVRAAQADPQGAEPLLREVLAARRRVFPAGHPEMAHALSELGHVVRAQGRYEEAESIFVQAVGMYRSVLGPEHELTMRCLADLGALHFDWGKLGIAERDWREVMTTNHRTLGPEHRSTLYAKDFLALILGEQGRVGEGEALTRESLDARRKRHGASHPEVAYSLRNIGLLKRLKGEPAEAETPLRDALAICRAAQCSVLGDVLTNLGAVLNELGNPHEAESLLQEALPILTEQAGPSHYATSVTRSALGYSFALQGRYAEAESLLLQAYHDQNTRKDYWGVKGRREILPLLVGLYRRQGKSAEAAKYERLLGIARANSQ